MPEIFYSKKAQNILDKAKSFAHKHRHSKVESAHVLSTLLGYKEIRTVLENKKINFKELKNQVNVYLNNSHFEKKDIEPEFTTTMQVALNMATIEALKRGSNQVELIDILNGILLVDDTIATQIIKNIQVLI